MKKNKRKYIALRLVEKPMVEADYGEGEIQKFPLDLPSGVIGILYVFNNKKSAESYYGKNVKCAEIEEDK
jgi:hypothetical protein